MTPRGCIASALLVTTAVGLSACGKDAAQKKADELSARALHAACSAEAATIQVASEAHVASKGTNPTTIGQFVQEGFIHSGGSITPATGTSYTNTNDDGTFTITMTFDSKGAPVIKGTIDGQPC